MRVKFGLHTRHELLSYDGLAKAWIRGDEGGSCWLAASDRIYCASSAGEERREEQQNSERK